MDRVPWRLQGRNATGVLPGLRESSSGESSQRVSFRLKGMGVQRADLLCDLWLPVSPSLQAVASSSAQKPWPCIPLSGTEGSSRQELAERRLTSCQDLDLMAFWAQLLGRLGTVPRGMCHHPTAWARMMGVGVKTQRSCLTCSSLTDCSSLFVWGLCLSLASPLLSISSLSSKHCVTAGFWVIPLGERLCVGDQPPACF